MQPIVKVSNVCKYFKDVRAVDGIDLEMQQGEFLALLGPNGAGKTTLVEMIEGIQHPDSGDIIIDGKQWKGHSRELHHLIGLSLQETHFLEKVTVSETLKLFASFYNLSNERIEEVLNQINLKEKQKVYVEKLSGGQRQRLALGIAMLNNAKLLLLDEPTTGLDPSARRDIWDILINLREKHNISLILTTHYMEEAEYLCERIVIMDKGKILAQGTLNEIQAENNLHEIIEFSFKDRTEDVNFISQTFPCRIELDDKSLKYKLFVEDIVSQLPLFLELLRSRGLELQTLECHKMNLDDLFIEMTGRRLNQ